jgi:hypothetical protein
MPLQAPNQGKNYISVQNGKKIKVKKRAVNFSFLNYQEGDW